MNKMATTVLVAVGSGIGAGVAAEHLEQTKFMQEHPDAWYAPGGAVAIAGALLFKKYPAAGAALMGIGGSLAFRGYNAQKAPSPQPGSASGQVQLPTMPQGDQSAFAPLLPPASSFAPGEPYGAERPLTMLPRQDAGAVLGRGRRTTSQELFNAAAVLNRSRRGL